MCTTSTSDVWVHICPSSGQVPRWVLRRGECIKWLIYDGILFYFFYASLQCVVCMARMRSIKGSSCPVLVHDTWLKSKLISPQNCIIQLQSRFLVVYEGQSFEWLLSLVCFCFFRHGIKYSDMTSDSGKILLWVCTYLERWLQLWWCHCHLQLSNFMLVFFSPFNLLCCLFVDVNCRCTYLVAPNFTAATASKIAIKLMFVNVWVCPVSLTNLVPCLT